MNTTSQETPRISMCQDQTIRLPRQPDGEAYYRIYSGGMRAAEPQDGVWQIEPILDNRRACAKGFLSTEEANTFFKQYGFNFVAFNRIIWTNGYFHSSWSPLILGQKNHLRGPADLWGSIASNLSRQCDESALPDNITERLQQIAAVLDRRTERERLARSISLSLRNMDISIEQISEFYNEHLVNHLESGKISGERICTTLDQVLFAHVHSFFMHIGAARDYLASFCALRIGKDPQKIDSFARLAETVRSEHFESDELLKLMYETGLFRQKPASSIKFEVSGWMKDVTDLRNELMHRRHYGDRFLEGMGFAEAVDLEAGVFRYVRPIILESGENDVQNVILKHYREMIRLSYEAAMKSGMDYSMLTLGEDDIISVDV